MPEVRLRNPARMMESAYIASSKGAAARLAGSNPAPGTYILGPTMLSKVSTLARRATEIELRRLCRASTPSREQAPRNSARISSDSLVKK